jgi:hypothetical protein
MKRTIGKDSLAAWLRTPLPLLLLLLSTDSSFAWSSGRGSSHRPAQAVVAYGQAGRATKLWAGPKSSFLSLSPAILASRPVTSRTTRAPTALSMRVPVLDDWKVLTSGRVTGTVKFHPSIPDGQVITTSPLEKPEAAAARKTIVTSTGSKYQLGSPQTVPAKANGRTQPSNASPAVVSLSELQRQAKLEFALTGEVIGDDDRQYLISGRPQKSTSGKSRIYKAYKANEDGLPTGDSLLIKLSSNTEAIEREASNYAKITKTGLSRGKFVELVDFVQPASVITKKFGSQSALVLERGAIDLKRYISEKGQLSGKEMREAAVSAASCLQAIHNSGLVWTDMKTENFIVTKDGQVKGIDLESAIPVQDNPVDYSPEATPPEFARAFLSGDGPFFVLQYNYDVWSFGMLLYELSTGKGYFDGMTPMQITKMLQGGPEIDLSDVEDDNLRNLIAKCLRLDPKRRPNIVKILLQPYFLISGFGPLSF